MNRSSTDHWSRVRHPERIYRKTDDDLPLRWLPIQSNPIMRMRFFLVGIVFLLMMEITIVDARGSLPLQPFRPSRRHEHHHHHHDDQQQQQQQQHNSGATISSSLSYDEILQAQWEHHAMRSWYFLQHQQQHLSSHHDHDELQQGWERLIHWKLSPYDSPRIRRARARRRRRGEMLEPPPPPHCHEEQTKRWRMEEVTATTAPNEDTTAEITFHEDMTNTLEEESIPNEEEENDNEPNENTAPIDPLNLTEEEIPVIPVDQDTNAPFDPEGEQGNHADDFGDNPGGSEEGAGNEFTKVPIDEPGESDQNPNDATPSPTEDDDGPEDKEPEEEEEGEEEDEAIPRSRTEGAIKGLSNCHMLFYTAQVGIGDRNEQLFTLIVDTGSTDLWVPSSRCDSTCFPEWRRFNSSLSRSFRPLYKNEMEDAYLTGVFTGRTLEGRLGQDEIHLAPHLEVPGQGFAEIWHIERLQGDGECSGWDGYLGLAPSDRGFTSDFVEENFDTLLGNLKDKNLLPRNMFAMYLSEEDDYPPRRPNDNLETPRGVVPKRASSEIVFGGIKQTHYTGCLTWVDVDPYIDREGDELELSWNVKLNGVRMGGLDLPSSDIAIFDTTASFILGSIEAVAMYAVANQMTCMAIDRFRDEIEDVDCQNEVGFMRAYAPCDTDVMPLEIEIGNATFTLDKSALMIPVDAAMVGKTDSAEQWCTLSLIPIPGIDGWLFGTGFLREHYMVYDFEDYRIGIAPRRRDGDTVEFCPGDSIYDITNPAPSRSPTIMTPPPTLGVATSAAEVTAEPTLTLTETEAPVRTDAPAPRRTFPPRPTPPPRRPTLPNRPTVNKTDDNTGTSSSFTIPVAVAAVALLVGILYCWRTRRRRVRYSRASYMDELYFGGDMELAEVS